MNSDKESYAKVISYLQKLVRDENIKEKNIHNLYIFYLSKTENTQQELIEYLKQPLIRLKHEDSNVQKVFFELEYAKRLFTNNFEALSLVLALMGKHSEAVKLALDKGFLDTAKYIASNVDDYKLKKKLWLQIFESDKSNDFNTTLNIMKESQILKIEDVLPCIMDNIKIEEFKTQISDCINVYEKSIKNLKEDIENYNDTAELIKNDIYNIKKKSMEVQFRQCNCEICSKSIKDENVYLYPCGHMFDENCIIDMLDEYSNYIDVVKEKMAKIRDLRKGIEELEKKKNDIDKEEKGDKVDLKILNFLSFTSSEKKTISSDELIKLDEMKKILSDILNEECVLCGDYMVESTQNKFKGVESDWKLA